MRKYDKEFKEEAVKLTDEVGIKQAAAQRGVAYYTLSEWRQKRKAYGDHTFVADEIYRLHKEKQKAQLDNVGRDELKKRITDMGDFLQKQPTAITEYDELLVRRLIEKVTICEDKFIVEFKSGVTVDVKE